MFFLLSVDFFQNSFRNTIRELNSLDLLHAGGFHDFL